MPRQQSYEEIYRNPFGQPRRAKDGPKMLGKSLFKRLPTGLTPRGHYKLAGLPVLSVGIGSVDLERRAVPLAQYPLLTVLERIFFKELNRRGLQLGRDFQIQESIEGGKTLPGGYAPDFTLYLGRGRTSVEVQGNIYHKGLVPAVRDEVKEMFLKSVGFEQVLYIDEDTLRSDDLTQAWFRRELGM